MADILLKEQETPVIDNLNRLKKEELDEIERSREYYEKLTDNINLDE